MADDPRLAEARTDTKFAEPLGEMRTGFAKIDGQLHALDARPRSVERLASGLRPRTAGMVGLKRWWHEDAPAWLRYQDATIPIGQETKHTSGLKEQ